jgi:hypothetical protein
VLLLLWSIPHEIPCREYFHPFLYYLKYNLSSIIKTPSKFSIISQSFALFLPNLKLFLMQLNHFIQLLYLVFFQGIQDFFQQFDLFVNCCSWLREDYSGSSLISFSQVPLLTLAFVVGVAGVVQQNPYHSQSIFFHLSLASLKVHGILSLVIVIPRQLSSSIAHP